MNEQNLLTVTSSPHLKHKRKTRTIMLDVIIALLPALGWAVWHFGIRSLLLTLVTVLAAILSEALYCRLTRQPNTVFDLSAVVTGMLLAFNLPVTIPMWMPVLGAVFAIVVVKELFGGLGQNIVNPALAARVFLFLSFPSYMQPAGGSYSEAVGKLIHTDAVASATPFAEGVSAADLPAMFFGGINGVLGEVSALCLLIGGIYLLVRRVISWQIPVSFLLSVGVVALIASPGEVSPFFFAAYHLLGGGLMLGALFMATDYATSPVTASGRLIFGCGCGLLTMLFRLFSSNTEGVSFAILIMNLLVYYLDRFTMPRKFGGKRRGSSPKAAKEAAGGKKQAALKEKQAAEQTDRPESVSATGAKGAAG